MHSSSVTPIIIGVGEIRQKNFTLDNTLEPAELILSAIRNAVQDVTIDVTTNIDSISVVPPWSWNYDNLPRLLAQRLGIEPSHLELSSHGGHTPALLCDAAAARIATGEAKVAVVTGGEALASLFACQKAGHMPPPGWTEASPDAKRYSPGDTSLMKDAGAVHSIGMPIQVYPLYENAYRKHNQQSFDENNAESAKLYADFDRIACGHPISWRSGESPRDANTIRTATKQNRMICTPYPLLMNAFNGVNLASACIVTSVEYATKLGVPQDKWVYITGGAGSNDKSNFWERSNYFSSLAIEYSIDKALESAGITKDEIDCFDFYSCFPIVPKLACKYVGLDVQNPSKPITLLGGLTSFGGAGNNYSLHAISEMTRVIRSRKHRNGLVLANGGVLSWQHAICLSAQPQKNLAPYLKREVLDNGQVSQGPEFSAQARGEARIETYTVDWDRTGPKLGHIVGRMIDDGKRFISNHGNELTLSMLANTELEPIGMKGFVDVGPDGRNLFTISPSVKL
ncbi:TLP1_add_C domain-containing protein [Fusarium acuminatum]|uniref:TLP1_add_C domain-containing protein n=1 Tax=Fusarium acuminatum TaxID=5515 RepID=A0ABZ2X4C1_9HYPO